MLINSAHTYTCDSFNSVCFCLLYMGLPGAIFGVVIFHSLVAHTCILYVGIPGYTTLYKKALSFYNLYVGVEMSMFHLQFISLVII